MNARTVSLLEWHSLFAHHTAPAASFEGSILLCNDYRHASHTQSYPLGLTPHAKCLSTPVNRFLFLYIERTMATRFSAQKFYSCSTLFCYSWKQLFMHQADYQFKLCDGTILIEQAVLAVTLFSLKFQVVLLSNISDKLLQFIIARA